MVHLDFPCDLCGRELEVEDDAGYLDVAGGDKTFTLAFHHRCAVKIAGAVEEARATGAATLVKP